MFTVWVFDIWNCSQKSLSSLVWETVWKECDSWSTVSSILLYWDENDSVNESFCHWSKCLLVFSCVAEPSVNFQASKSVAKSHSVRCVICSIFSCFMLLFFESLFLIRQAISFSQSREDSRWKQWNTTRSGRRSWFLSSLFLSFTWLIVSHEVICSHLTLFSCHRHWTKLKLNIGFAKECRSNWTRCITFWKKSKECFYRFTCFKGNERGRSGKINWA